MSSYLEGESRSDTSTEDFCYGFVEVSEDSHCELRLDSSFIDQSVNGIYESLADAERSLISSGFPGALCNPRSLANLPASSVELIILRLLGLRHLDCTGVRADVRTFELTLNGRR